MKSSNLLSIYIVETNKFSYRYTVSNSKSKKIKNRDTTERNKATINPSIMSQLTIHLKNPSVLLRLVLFKPRNIK